MPSMGTSAPLPSIKDKYSPDGDPQAEDLLELELDCGTKLISLGDQVVGVGDRGGEFASLVKTWAQQTRNLFDKGLRCEEGVVFLG
ncbi:hypothetical protein BC937DRAFT_93658 [Endogone sp. FLAS-F59071]|nr:hypothetical protein BC937DRAFT_93658 [Endogone sp. FLAS-F59071]|eukprot:RUS21100.1 hypothetical protein BC937DRAFT_93658 [Endogone sp. FLAS-F59071]